MTRRLKALSLAFAAVLAMGALTASAASAASFHSEHAHTILSGAQPAEVNDVFTTNSGTATCQNITYSGTQSAATSSGMTVTPSWSGCTAFGFVNMTVDVNECAYVFTPTETQQWHISCPPGQSIVTTAFNCHVRFGSQTLSGVSYTSSGTGATRDIYMHINTSGITYTQENKSFPMCTGGNGTFANGTYKGSATVTGTDTFGNHVGIWAT